jgi:hypothetical protein
MSDNRNPNSDEQKSTGTPGQNPRTEQDTQKSNTSNQDSQDENPQQGSEWNNYRTRELGGEGEGNASTPRDSE